MPPKILAVGNLKGGTSKTTLSINIACALSAGRKVRLVDADGQRSATAWAEAGELPIEVLPAPLDDIDQAQRWMTDIETASADLVVIDLPPNMAPATAAALMVCDVVVIPVRASMVDITATAEALAMVADARQRRSGELPKAFLVPSQVDRRTAAGREIEAALHELGEPVGPAVGYRTAFAESFGSWVGAYAPRSAGHVEIQTLAAVIAKTLKLKVKANG